MKEHHMGKKWILMMAAQFSVGLLCAQDLKKAADTLFQKELNEVVVTATRNERKLGNVAVPVSIISQKTIQQAASLRLKDILQEQPGLFITSGFGAGVQMQGLNPDYTLILVDGEPLVGRTSGVLDLNRLTVGNIRKIEIVKGPSSGLYGSEALAGVINIITDKSYDGSGQVSAPHGTYQTVDLNGSAGMRFGKLGVQAFINHFRTDGYSIRPFSVERSKLPISRTTPQLQLNMPLGSRTTWNGSGRYNHENIKNEITVTNNGLSTVSNGRERNRDLNISSTLTHQFHKNLKSSLRLYATRFEGSQVLNTNNGAGYDDYFLQQFYRAENQTDINLRKNISLTAGAGYIREMVNSNRYDDKNSRKDNDVLYGFMQAEWKPVSSLVLIGGLRYDDNRLYASAFSPKIAAKYTVNPRFSLQASYGRGFKAPDFRQLYLNFTNTAAGGYSVLGALEARETLAQLNAAGLIKQFEDDYGKLASLKPEFSNGINIGFTAFPVKKVQWQVNLFRNDISNLIESRLMAVRVDNSQIFSYINVQRAYTQGVETNVKYLVGKGFQADLGYQFLQTADKDQLKKIKEGNYYFTRDENNFSVPLKRSDYIGLPNRSPHMATVKLLYEKPNQSWFVNTRAIYRSKWVVSDRDGNGIYNKQDEFARAYVLLNLSGGYHFRNGIRLQAGIENALDHVDAINLPNAPGRSFYGSITYQFKTKKK